MTSTPQPRSRFVDIDGSRRHLVEWGEPGAPTVLLQHGMRDHARSWDWFASRLARDHHVVVPDLRGHGDSDWSAEGAYGLSDYVFDLAEIVASLGLAGFDLVGHSLGGAHQPALCRDIPRNAALADHHRRDRTADRARSVGRAQAVPAAPAPVGRKPPQGARPFDPLLCHDRRGRGADGGGERGLRCGTDRRAHPPRDHRRSGQGIALEVRPRLPPAPAGRSRTASTLTMCWTRSHARFCSLMARIAGYPCLRPHG
ncbi:alpha/beta fold hydrolase [Novosphingobium colocasiae]